MRLAQVEVVACGLLIWSASEEEVEVDVISDCSVCEEPGAFPGDADGDPGLS